MTQVINMSFKDVETHNSSLLAIKMTTTSVHVALFYGGEEAREGL
jgi:hypothetical protein